MNDALTAGIVGLCSSATSASGIDLADTDSNIGFPFIGGIDVSNTGVNSNIGPGSGEHGSLVGTNDANPTSGPQAVGNSFTTQTGLSRGSESGIWNVDLITGALTLAWTNKGQSPSTTTIYIEAGYNTLAFAGDVSQLNQGFGTPVTLSFIPI
jgi:hypothetical protein